MKARIVGYNNCKILYWPAHPNQLVSPHSQHPNNTTSQDLANPAAIQIILDRQEQGFSNFAKSIMATQIQTQKEVQSLKDAVERSENSATPKPTVTPTIPPGI